jgi:hypothetical protein
MDTEERTSRSVGTEISSADEALVKSPDYTRPKITVKTKTAKRDVSPLPEGTKEQYLESMKWAEKVSRVQTLIEFLAPFIGGENVPYIIAIKFKPKLGIEDETFLRTWNLATHKCSKYLMDSSFNQAKLHLDKLNDSYSTAITGLKRAAGPVNTAEIMQRIEKFKLDKFSLFTKQRAEKQERYLNPPAPVNKPLLLKPDDPPARGRGSISKRKLNKDPSPTSSRSNSRELQKKKKQGRPDSQSKEKKGYRAENSNYKGKNFDPYFDPRSSKGQRSNRSTSRESPRCRQRDATPPRKRRDASPQRHQGKYKKARRERRDRDDSESDSDLTRSEQDLFKKFMKIMKKF